MGIFSFLFKKKHQVKYQEELAEQERQAEKKRQEELVEQEMQAEQKRQEKLAEQERQAKEFKKVVTEIAKQSRERVEVKDIEELMSVENFGIGIVKYYNSIEKFRDNDFFGGTNKYNGMIPIEEMDDFYRYPNLYYPDFMIDIDDNITYLEEFEYEKYLRNEEYTGYIRHKIEEYYEYHEKDDFEM